MGYHLKVLFFKIFPQELFSTHQMILTSFLLHSYFILNNRLLLCHGLVKTFWAKLGCNSCLWLVFADLVKCFLRLKMAFYFRKKIFSITMFFSRQAVNMYFSSDGTFFIYSSSNSRDRLESLGPSYFFMFGHQLGVWM